jgi:serine/threonine protein phosphatase PrpC
LKRDRSTKVVNPLNLIKLKRIPSDEKSTDTIDSEENLNYKIISNLAYRTQAGMNGEGITKINQDSHVVSENIFGLENFNIYGVLDGHGNKILTVGSNGHLVSAFINTHFCEFFGKKESYRKQNILDLKTEKIIYDKLKENNFEIVRQSFTSAETLLAKAKYDVNFSGTTSVLVITMGNRIICANAGDSRAILVREVSNF